MSEPPLTPNFSEQTQNQNRIRTPSTKIFILFSTVVFFERYTLQLNNTKIVKMSRTTKKKNDYFLNFRVFSLLFDSILKGHGIKQVLSGSKTNLIVARK